MTEQLANSYSYLNLLKYYQELQLKLENTKHGAGIIAPGILYRFNEMLKHEKVIEVLQEIDISSITKEIEKKDSYKKDKELVNLQRQYLDLERYLLAGNLRHVVYFLYKDEGLSAKEFANKLNRSEQEIADLTENGTVSNALLEDICKYFGIIKSSDFMRYVWRNERWK